MSAPRENASRRGGGGLHRPRRRDLGEPQLVAGVGGERVGLGELARHLLGQRPARGPVTPRSGPARPAPHGGARAGPGPPSAGRPPRCPAGTPPTRTPPPPSTSPRPRARRCPPMRTAASDAPAAGHAHDQRRRRHDAVVGAEHRGAQPAGPVRLVRLDVVVVVGGQVGAGNRAGRGHRPPACHRPVRALATVAGAPAILRPAATGRAPIAGGNGWGSRGGRPWVGWRSDWSCPCSRCGRRPRHQGTSTHPSAAATAACPSAPGSTSTPWSRTRSRSPPTVGPSCSPSSRRG